MIRAGQHGIAERARDASTAGRDARSLDVLFEQPYSRIATVVERQRLIGWADRAGGWRASAGPLLRRTRSGLAKVAPEVLAARVAAARERRGLPKRGSTTPRAAGPTMTCARMVAMTGRGGSSDSSGQGLAAGEREQLVHVLETRFAPSLDAASALVRDAERDLAVARERLARAESAAPAPYASDPLTFMRQSVAEEVEALERKTTEKKLRAAYRFLIDRAVELAGAEVDGFHADRFAVERAAQDGPEACRSAVQQAEEAAEAARRTQERVQGAERSARDGLMLLLTKLASGPPVPDSPSQPSA